MTRADRRQRILYLEERMREITNVFLALGIPTTFQMDEQRARIQALREEQDALIADDINDKTEEDK